LNSAAEKLTAVDELGRPIDSDLLLLIVLDLFLTTHQAKKIAVPVAASMGVEQIAGEHNVEVVRVANDHLAMMEIYRRGGVDFVGGTRGGFIFPGFQMGADAMLAAVKLLEMMASTKTRLGAIRKKYEHLIRRFVSVPCPWSLKGTVMRKLIAGTDDKERQMIDGVRVFENGGWVLVAPDRTRAAFNILAESDSSEGTEALVQRYRDLVEEWQEN
jgi:mannose-1-phosphate guanylyltransferase/phosphomannomutase